MAISAKNLTVRYGRSTIIDDMTFGPLDDGKITGLIGPNGAGKSTLVKTLAGINTPSEGSADIVVDGRALSPKERVQAVGYVPQDMLSRAALTAFESVMVSARRGEGTSKALESTAAVMHRLGITKLSDRMISDMSGGQRQLVAVAQMLVRSPRIMLLDEPTSALDLRHQVELLQIIQDEVRGDDRQALVALHDLNLAARFCDELLVIKDGHTIAKGTPTEVLTPELLERVYGISARIINDAGVPIVCPVLRLPRHETPTDAGPMDPIAVNVEDTDPDVINAVTSTRA
ncbi:ABC transporter ATP-binding protein [Corynebacterium sp. CCUG 69979]|uniref:ABC transporter ATP-binding protein n=1 Tax=Corynebacterium sp. CCUG 69979 TaxID=2823890 RepID=UPI00210A5564|nr:ABC transporter ATP-binding protein [Corynebacterium sp. CCUG 69979]MCQ4625726.1 ABC transporter ATP-binding protein [Corynebacterium sp. CCUG 69979]